MNNHAGNIQEIDEANFKWLAGFLDADGYLGMTYNSKYKDPSKLFSPEVVFYNNNLLIVDKIVELLEKYDIYFYRYDRSNGVVDVHIRRLPQILKLLQYVGPYLIGKREPSYYLQELCIYRLQTSRCREDYNIILYNSYLAFTRTISSRVKNHSQFDSYGSLLFDNSFVNDLDYNNMLPWIAGFLDGDGSFSISKLKRGKNRHLVHYYPVVNFTTGSQNVSKFVKTMLQQLDLNFKLDVRKRAVGLPWEEYVVESFDGCRLICGLVLPYIIGKKRQAKVLWEFCNNKLLGWKHQNLSNFRTEMLHLNSLYKSSETICENS